MQLNSLEQAVTENLKDAGCGDDTIEAFLYEWRRGNLQNGLRLLAKHRCGLLAEAHQSQQQIENLDYLIYQIKKAIAEI